MLFSFILVILTIPSEFYKLPVYLPFNLEIYRIFGAIMLMAWFASLLIDNNISLRKTPLDFEFLVVFVAVFVSILVNLNRYETNDDFSSAIKALIFFISFILIFYFINSTLRYLKDINFILRCLTIIGGIISLFGLFERLTGFNFFKHIHEFIPILVPGLDDTLARGGGIRISGPVSHPIAFSAILAMIFPFAFYFFVTAKEYKLKILYGSAAGLIVCALTLTGSRTGFLGLVAAILLLYIGIKEYRRNIVTMIIPIIFIIHMIFPGAMGSFKKTLSPEYLIKNEIGNESGRIEDYPRIRAEFSKRPFFGLGYNSFDPRKFFFIDNQYLKFLVEIGLFGAMAFIWLFLRIFMILWRTSKNLLENDKYLFVTFAASISTFIISSATFDTFGFSQVPYIFFIISSLGISYSLILDGSGGSDAKAS